MGNFPAGTGDRSRMERSRGGAYSAILVVASLVTSSCGGGGGAGAVGDPLPAVSVTPLAGGDEIMLSEIDGPAVVNLWATWCAPCRKEIPDFEAVHTARGDSVRFIGINIGEEADQATKFLTDVGATYDQFLDEEGFVQTQLEATAMPTTVVIDASGAITTRHVGPMDQDALDEAIDAALTG